MPTAVVLTSELVTRQMYWPASEREAESSDSELVRVVSCCMLILLSELDSSCWIPPELKYHENTGDVSSFAVHVKVTEPFSTRVTTVGVIEMLPPVGMGMRIRHTRDHECTILPNTVSTAVLDE